MSTKYLVIEFIRGLKFSPNPSNWIFWNPPISITRDSICNRHWWDLCLSKIGIAPMNLLYKRLLLNNKYNVLYINEVLDETKLCDIKAFNSSVSHYNYISNMLTKKSIKTDIFRKSDMTDGLLNLDTDTDYIKKRKKKAHTLENSGQDILNLFTAFYQCNNLAVSSTAAFSHALFKKSNSRLQLFLITNEVLMSFAHPSIRYAHPGKGLLLLYADNSTNVMDLENDVLYEGASDTGLENVFSTKIYERPRNYLKLGTQSNNILKNMMDEMANSIKKISKKLRWNEKSSCEIASIELFNLDDVEDIAVIIDSMEHSRLNRQKRTNKLREKYE
ncbi:hypothetical protein H8356DRAFT_1358620 [Neocallimastix lanati (nom. inval.)]|nr:hypothetical protein H8356DRAFT_1358620 [Neocallimastix sp. JGI-2020a]